MSDFDVPADATVTGFPGDIEHNPLHTQLADIFATSECECYTMNEDGDITVSSACGNVVSFLRLCYSARSICGTCGTSPLPLSFVVFFLVWFVLVYSCYFSYFLYTDNCRDKKACSTQHEARNTLKKLYQNVGVLGKRRRRTEDERNVLMDFLMHEHDCQNISPSSYTKLMESLITNNERFLFRIPAVRFVCILLFLLLVLF